MNLICLYICLFLGSPTMHDMHICKSKIKYSESDKAFQVSVHVFIDDLETVIEDRNQVDVRMFSDHEDTRADSMITDYVNERMFIAINGQEYTADWIGKELSEDLQAVWCYLEIPFSEVIETIEIDNNILQDKFDDQMNVVILDVPGKKKDHLLFPKKRKARLIEF